MIYRPANRMNTIEEPTQQSQTTPPPVLSAVSVSDFGVTYNPAILFRILNDRIATLEKRVQELEKTRPQNSNGNC